jgi:hypothetical protein
LVQGAGGQALSALSSAGFGQTYQSVSRVGGTTYYNTTGKPIKLLTQMVFGAGGGVTASIVINGGSSITYCQSYSPSTASWASGMIEIPPFASYVITYSAASTITNFELR